MTIETISQTLIVQFGYTEFVFDATLKDISEEAALFHPQPGGNCMNWIAGHLTRTRGNTLEVLHQELPFEMGKYDRYKRAAEPLTDSDNPDSGILTMDEIQSDFFACKSPLLAGLDALTPEQSAAPAPFSPFDNKEETVGSLLAALLFHESYHIGQLGLLRRLVGADGIIK
ncbi:MAG: DinB family protein [bacterium]|nr:DinB family protein [bacterium]